MGDRFGFLGKYTLADDTPTDSVPALAAGLGWPLIADIPRGTRQMRSLAWRTGDDDQLHYLEDHRRNVRVLLLVASTAEGLAALRDVVHGGIAVSTEADRLDRLDRAEEPGDLVRELNALSGLRTGVEPDHDRGPDAALDERWERAVTRLAGHPDRHVRRALLFTVVGLVRRHPELAGPLLARRGEDTELAPLLDAFAGLATAT